MELLSNLGAFHGISGIPSSFDDPENYFSIGLKATWLVFNGFARKFSVAAARYGEQSAIQAHADVRRQLLSAVIFAYLNAQLAKENIVIAQADAAFNSRLLTEAKLRYDVGAGALSDVINFQVQANAAQIQITQSQLDYQNALNSVAMLMGITEGRLPGGVQLAPFGATTDKELAALESGVLIAQALDQRPDINQLANAVQAAEAGVQTARSAYYPSVVLSAGIEGQRPEDPGFEGDDFGNTIALGLSWNLFSGGLTRAQVSEARARVSELNHNLAYAKTGVANEVQSVVARIRSIRQQVALQESNTKLVQQQRDLVEKEYTSGVGSLVRLNEAQKTLTVTQGRLVLTRVALRQAWYNLQAITGQILAMFGSDTLTQKQP
jgi:outer membrane protein TolC